MRPFLTEITLVYGYDSDANPRQTAIEGGDRFRLAVVLDSHDPDSPDWELDFVVYRALMLAVREAVAGCQWRISFDEGQTFTDLAAALASIEPQPREDWAPARRIEARNQSGRKLVIETEDWVLRGGPPLYHDTYTFVCYGSGPGWPRPKPGSVDPRSDFYCDAVNRKMVALSIRRLIALGSFG